MKALALIVLVGCQGYSVEPTLVFSQLDDATISQIVFAASGSDASVAIGLMNSFSDGRDDDPSCPLVEATENGVTITGGCTTARGVEVQGVARSIVELRTHPEIHVLGSRFTIHYA